MFEVEEKQSFAQQEESVLGFWKEKQIFELSVEQRKDRPVFSFYDGPPFATGLPHYGHILAGTIKDTVLRYKTMQGFCVPRRFGWDCHGLPVENEIEKAHELSGAGSIAAFGIDTFNEECRKIVLRYVGEWEKTVRRMGRWVDFSQTYKTMDPSYMESVWWVFAQLYAKGLVYEGFKVMPFSAQLGTPLSNFEANLNYKDVEDPSLTITFTLEKDPKTSLLVWTTTPWTLPSNLALMVHPQGVYVKVKDPQNDRFFILAEARVQECFKDKEIPTPVETFLGDKLIGLRYEPPFSYFKEAREQGAFRIIAEDSISLEEGTGIVHAAPAFGEVDFFACTRSGIEPVCPVDQNGKFTKEIPDFCGLFVKDADKKIIHTLKESNKVFRHSQIRHRYPFCWRSDTPLIYKAVSTWFVAVEKIKPDLLKAAEQINWVPEHIKQGRFGKWLENARDWAISRSRYWGTPIPLWQSADGEMVVIDSIKELERRTQTKITDLHTHHIDTLTFEENGKTFKRIPDVFDCWFESGSMPYAQNHFPFENEEKTLNNFPADFIGEGLDQTRGWFYTLTVLSTALFNKPAFKNAIVNGILLAENGAKMSKRLKNYPEPDKVFEDYGADAVRLYLLGSPAVRGEDLRFSQNGVELILRSALIPLWNAYVFFATYARIYSWDPRCIMQARLPIDCWILSVQQDLIEKTTRAMDNYKLDEAVEPLISFIDQLTNWYIRRNRNRFWAEDDSENRREAFSTLYTVLCTTCRMIAPFIPFLSETLFLRLRTLKDPISVHLTDYPVYDSSLRDLSLEKQMSCAQIAVSLGHALRKQHSLKVRQPLKAAHIIATDKESLAALKRQELIIKEELNVKHLHYHEEETHFVTLSLKPNFRILGKKVGQKMPALQKALTQCDQGHMHLLLSGKPLHLDLEGTPCEVLPSEVTLERKVLEGICAGTQNGITVALETTLDEDLILEGLARELVNKINTMRREEGYAVTDRITIHIDTSHKVRTAFDAHEPYILHETLATSITFGPNPGTPWDLNGEWATILLAR